MSDLAHDVESLRRAQCGVGSRLLLDLLSTTAQNDSGLKTLISRAPDLLSTTAQNDRWSEDLR